MNPFFLCTKPHSFILGISIAPLQVHYHTEALPTAFALCRSKHAKTLGVQRCQLRIATLTAQGSYMTARVGFEHATIRTQGIKPTTELPCSTLNFYGQQSTLYCIFYLVPVFVSKLK